jgi:hypothetical protein
MNAISVGISGHREIEDERGVMKRLTAVLEQLSRHYRLDSVVSPLADGADRLVAKILMEQYGARLITPLPFEVNAYREDFTPESKKEFDVLLLQSENISEVGSLKEQERNRCYMKVGERVVEESDVLIALWDGKKANGEGGTGDVVAYAKAKGKPILHINPEDLHIEKINFESVL